MKCTQCGSLELREGFIYDQAVRGQSREGYARWISGPVEMLRWPRRPMVRGRSWFKITAYQCPACGHLELFADVPLNDL